MKAKIYPIGIGDDELQELRNLGYLILERKFGAKLVQEMITINAADILIARQVRMDLADYVKIGYAIAAGARIIILSSNTMPIKGYTGEVYNAWSDIADNHFALLGDPRWNKKS